MSPIQGPGLLLVGHGTRSAGGVDQFHALVARLARQAPVDVAGGFIELAAPPLADTVAALVAAGHRRLVAVPLVLVAAGHSKGDIPAALARERVRHPGLDFAYGRPIGPHPEVLAELAERIDAVLDRHDRAATAVLLVGRGTTDPDANAEVVKTARLLWEGRGLSMVETAFISLAAPSVPAGLDRVRALGAHRVVVLPYFLLPGVLPDRVASHALAWARAHPEVEVRLADVLGDSPGLARVVLERYAEAATGPVAMNCDTCLYRVALPGAEHRQGAPQRPHTHPDDPVGHLHDPDAANHTDRDTHAH